MSWALRKLGRFIILRDSVVTSGRKLRAYSGLEMLSVIGRLALKLQKLGKGREGMEFWYGERREDPGVSGAND